ncbi:MAG: PAS domain-containing protein [Pirellula sp.]|nr:PAS domain-containing protein [Pirellula sp.]
MEMQFKAAMAFVSEGIIFQDAQGRIVFCNPACERILGLSADQLMGKTPIARDCFLTNEDGSPFVGEKHPAMITPGTGHPIRNFVFGVGGVDRARRWIAVNTDPVYGESSELEFVVCRFSDVTDQREQSRSLEVIADAAKLGTWDWHIPSGRVKYNHHWASNLGYDLSQIEPSITAWEQLIAPASRVQSRERLREHLEGRTKEYRNETQLLHRDGTYRWVLSVGRVIARNIDNTPQRMVGIHLDMSESKRIEAELRTLTGRYEASISGSSDGLWDRDFETEYEWYSERFWTLLGYPTCGPFPSNEHQSFLDHLHPEDVEATRNAVQKSCLDGTYYHHQYRLRLLDGRYRWFLSRGNVQRNEQGKVVRMSGTLRDIHELKMSEIALLEANEATKAANVAKSEFLANMSHEIRTPMTAILGFSDMLAVEERDTSNSASKLEYINTIQRNGEHLLDLINDILDISKIEAEKVVLEQLIFPLAEFLQDIVSTLKVKSKHKGIELNLEIGSDLPACIQSDPLRLRQVLVNLIGNAIKFTERGSVTVRAHLDNNREHLVIEIVDTGIGLTAKQVKKLFGAFEQADASTTRKYGGTGLGLRISKRLAELIGGEISIESDFGRGSTFALRLSKSCYETIALEAYKANSQEFEPPTILEPSQSTAAPLAGLNILLAEDGPDNQRLIGHILRKAGALVEVAENGKLAIGKLTNSGTLDGELLAPLPFHLIISDINMPEIDGYSLARILQAKGLRLPIIALTADAMSDERQKCLNAGFSAYATKPIDKHSLIAACRAWGKTLVDTAEVNDSLTALKSQ